MGQKSKNVKYNPIEWAMWANVMGVLAGTLMFIGGILAQFNFVRKFLGYYAMWVPTGVSSTALALPKVEGISVCVC